MSTKKEQILKEINVENNLATKCYLEGNKVEMHEHLKKVEELKKEFNEITKNDKEQD